jgi:hypothetical protein
MTDESTDDFNQKLVNEVRMLNALVKLLNDKVEGLRTHMGSTGYFLQTATEDLQKSVAALLIRIEALK